MKKEVKVLKLKDLEEKSVCKNTEVKANNKRKTLFSKGNRDKMRGYIVIDIETCKGSTKTYIAVVDTGTNVKVYKSTGASFAGAWSEVKSLTTGKEVFFENFIGKTMYFKA